MFEKIKDLLTNRQKLKILLFGLIGLFNTLLDIVVYLVMLNLSHNIVVSNIIATSIALIGSYLLNSKITFQAESWNKKMFISFVVVTVFGLWVLQTSVIYLLNDLVKVSFPGLWHGSSGLDKLFKQLLPKLLATGVTLVWNYTWYNRVIFKNNKEEARRLTYTDL